MPTNPLRKSIEKKVADAVAGVERLQKNLELELSGLLTVRNEIGVERNALNTRICLLNGEEDRVSVAEGKVRKLLDLLA